jgi:hypothetical protein
MDTRPTLTVHETVFTEHSITEKFNAADLPGPTYSHYLILLQDRISERFAVMRTECIRRTLEHLRYGQASYSSAYKRLYPDKKARVEHARIWLAPMLNRHDREAIKGSVEYTLAKDDRLLDTKRQASVLRRSQ